MSFRASMPWFEAAVVGRVSSGLKPGEEVFASIRKVRYGRVFLALCGVNFHALWEVRRREVK
jgi:hypothetical protein